MRILTTLTYYRPHYSGLTIYTERLARALAKRGHQVTILTSRFDEHLPARETLDGIEIIRPKVWFHISKGVIMPGMFLEAWKWTRWADVVHLHVPQLDAAAIALISKLRRKPVILTYHCDLRLPQGIIHRLANLASNIANRVTAQLADVIVHNSRDYAENSPFLRTYLKKVRPIFPPVELPAINEDNIQAFRRKYHIAEDEKVIGMAARLASEKGVEHLVLAMFDVLRTFPKARVLFVGPTQEVVGEERYAARLWPLIEALGEHWTFLGVVPEDEMAAFFRVCDVTVLPSINSTESFGLVQVESISCGTPVIATDLPGVRVPVHMSKMGHIVPPANPQALAKALIDVLSKPKPFNNDGAKNLISHASPLAVAEEYEHIFASLIAIHGVQENRKAAVRPK